MTGDQIIWVCFLFLGFILRGFFEEVFKKKDFKIAKIEELPEGDYFVYDKKPKGGSCVGEILVIRKSENNKAVGDMMAVLIDYSLSAQIKNNNNGDLSKISVFCKKHFCFVRFYFRDMNNSNEERVSLVFKKPVNSLFTGNYWEMVYKNS